MGSEEIKVGDIIAGMEPDEHVEVKRVAPFGNKILVEGVGVTSRREVKRPLEHIEFDRLTKIRGLDFSFNGDAGAFLLGVEAQRIRIAYQFDPLFAVNSSVVDVLPHQVEAVYRYLLPLPRIRFLLADDTGAGKTIMTGLLIKELLFRNVISKVLIITPGGLTKQWRGEMREKFSLDFDLVNRASFEARPGMFSRTDDGLFVTSIDFISRHDGCLNEVKDTQWDMIVVDEAHKLSAYEYGNKVDRSARYEAIEEIAPHTDHLLLLTATPHRGRQDTFRRLLMLLDEDLFQKDEHVIRRIQSSAKSSEAFEGEEEISRARNRFFLRRLKEEMVNWDNLPLFKPRHTDTVGYDLTLEELNLYEAVTAYVRSRRKQAKAQKNRNVELTLVVMQRRLASSIYAITRTLRNRLASLDEVLAILRDPNRTQAEKKRLLRSSNDDLPENLAQYEDMDESQRENVDKRIFRQVLSDDPEEVEREREHVDYLLKMAEGLREQDHKEAKFIELLKVLDSSEVIRRDDEKLVIFTEHKDTLVNLAERLTQKGYGVATIDGSMDTDAREEAQRKFRRDETKIMVATDAAGEGINLQFCRFLINWDIPWNPNRLEQRMGRVHRYGQRNDVWVYNLVASNTREGAVLERMLKKLDVMREQMGNDRVYDVIDELLEDVPLMTLLERAIDEDNNKAAVAEIEQQMSGDMRARADQLVALQKKQSLASSLDLRAAQDLRDTSDERRLQPYFIQRFFTKAWTQAGGTITEDRHFPVFHLSRTPNAILETARQTRLSVSETYDSPFVFDKDLVSVASRRRVPDHTRLLGPGHPLFSALLEWAIRQAREAFAKGVVLVDPNIAQPQRLWLVDSSIEDGRREEKKRLAHKEMNVVVADHLGVRATSPANLLNFVVPDGPVETPAVPSRTNDELQQWTYEHLTEKQLQRVQEHRQAECDLRRQYLETTFTDLIVELQGRLNDYYQRELFGNENPEERQKLERRIQKLKERKAQRLAELDLMLRLSANLPEVVTSALVVPAPIATVEDEIESLRRGVPMRRDDEVERIAMNVVLRYERARGWTPFDVSQDGEHYDIRSEAPAGEKRFIEVKGRAQSGAIILTGPEADKLRQLGDRAFLYVVTFCKGERPRLRIIQNPMEYLSPEALYRQVQYLVQERDWRQQGEEVNDLPALD